MDECFFILFSSLVWCSRRGTFKRGGGGAGGRVRIVHAAHATPEEGVTVGEISGSSPILPIRTNQIVQRLTHSLWGMLFLEPSSRIRDGVERTVSMEQ